MMHGIWMRCCLGVLCLLGAPAAAEFLVERGVVRAVIVIGEQATPVERFAAEELQRYVAQMTAVTLPIQTLPPGAPVQGFEILLGRPATHARLARVCADARLRLEHERLGDDGYVVQTVSAGPGQAALVLSGTHDRSALYAVYHLLETCGARFFGYQTRQGELIPRTASLALPRMDVAEKPVMKYRFVSDNGFSATDRTKLANIADWSAKNRCNAFVLTPARAGENWDQIALEEVQKRGLQIVGPGHILARLTPGTNLFASHPEYFPLLGGTRKSTHSAVWGGALSFCYANEEAMQIVVTNALKYLDAAPFIDLFALYPPDGSQRGVQCQCARCASLSASDWYLTLMNNLARALETRPRAPKLLWIAYNECGVPPRQVQPYANGRNFVLLWCNDLRVHDAPMESEANRHAAPYLAWKPQLKAIKTNAKKNPTDEDLAAYHRWQQWRGYLAAGHFAGDVVLLEYYNLHVAHSLRVPMLRYQQSGPWPNRLMQRDFEFYVRQGIMGWQNCTDYYNDDPTPYWNRLGAQLMWNPSADVAAIDRDFYRQLFGLAGPAMENYFSALWPELAAADASAAALTRLVALGQQLDSAEAALAQAGDETLMARFKRVQAFHRHCLALKAASAAGQEAPRPDLRSPGGAP
jgi:hypothetical protein